MNVYFQKKQYKEVIETDELVRKLDQRYLPPYYDLSRAHLLKGDHGDIEAAYWYRKRLLELLEDKDAVDLERNQTAWSFPTDSEEVYLNNYSEKRSYAYYSILTINP